MNIFTIDDFVIHKSILKPPLYYMYMNMALDGMPELMIFKNVVPLWKLPLEEGQDNFE